MSNATTISNEEKETIVPPQSLNSSNGANITKNSIINCNFISNNKNRVRYGYVFLLIVIVIIVLCVSIVLSRSSPSSSTSIELLVNTNYGQVVGFYLDYSNDSPSSSMQLRAWRGIPFAEPPIGDLRWSSPQSPKIWNTPLECKEYRQPCIQSIDGSGSEDCLYLNIYSSDPTYIEDEGPWPVLVYIYGGGLMSGIANGSFGGLIYSTASSARGLVVVEISYRLNIFGYLAASPLSSVQNGTSGNYGLQDQIWALKWVKENIAGFNGDPYRVTLAGQSSGGTSILALYAAPAAKGLFSGAISMSGSPNITTPLSVAEMQNSPIINQTGCDLPGFSSSQVVSCMRNLSAYDLYLLIPNAWNMPGIWGLPSGPSGQHYQALLVVDGKVISESFPNALASGLIDVPLLFGNMACEPDEDPDIEVYSYTYNQWEALVNSTFSTWPNSNEISETMLSLYYSAASINPQVAYDNIVSDYGLYCGEIILSQQAMIPVGKRTSSIFLYYDNWALERPFLGDGGYLVHYAYHDLFYFEMTGQWSLIGNGSYIPQPSDLKAQAIIQSAVWGFIENRHPVNWKSIDQSPGWPQNYTINVIEPSKVSPFLNYRQNICSFYADIGLSDPMFWWAN